MQDPTNRAFTVRLASSDADLRAAQRLRYDVFVAELAGDGPLVDHDNRLEIDQFDPFFDHLMLIENATKRVVGVYRLMRQAAAEQAGGFYSAGEYDLRVLTGSGRKLLELGRSCLHPAYRGGVALHHLWNGVARYIAEHDIDVLFGVASFHGADLTAHAAPLSLLHHRHLAPEPLRVVAHGQGARGMDLIGEDRLDRRHAMVKIPGLIKAYLRLGGFVGQGAYVDEAFNTTDVCLVMDVRQIDARQARLSGIDA